MNVGVILSGCGYLDGAEIRESVLCLLALSRAGAQARCFAPDRAQLHVVDHRRGDVEAGASRNMLREAARIARGEIAPLAELELDRLDALLFPGGFGVAKNLCDFASAGPAVTVDPAIERVIVQAHGRGMPQGFVCIAPVLAAAALRGRARVTLTIGQDPDTAAALESLGARHQPRAAHEAVLDRENKIVSTPAYMLEAPLHEIATGIDSLVQDLLGLVPAEVRSS